MCFTHDDGEMAEFYNDVTRVARKPHKCLECRDGVAIGETHRYISGKWDGSFEDFRICARCERVREAIRVHEEAEGCHGDEAFCPFGELSSYLHEFNLTIEAVAASAPIAYQVIGEED